MREIAHLSRLNTAAQMASGLAHELNQPLTAIANYAAAALRLARTGQIATNALEEIISESLRAGVIIRRLRSLVRRQEPRRQDLDLNACATDAAGLLRPDISQRGLLLKLELSRDLPHVYADPVQLTQVIVNLMQNAIDAMADGAMGRDLVLRTTNDAGHEVSLSVIDSGCGIPEGQRSRIFEAFFTTKPAGLGVGLSISRSIVEAHGGKLIGEPNPNGGMTFRFSLPVDVAAAEKGSSHESNCLPGG